MRFLHVSAHVASRVLIIRRQRVPADDRVLVRRFWMAMLAVLCGVVAFGIYGQAAESHALDARVASLTQQNAALQQQISDRQREIVDAQTAAWLVEEARKLGYVFPGEKVFVITPPGSSAPASGGVTAPLPSFSALPTPTPLPSPSPSPNSSPTPFQFTVGSPSPTPH